MASPASGPASLVNLAHPALCYGCSLAWLISSVQVGKVSSISSCLPLNSLHVVEGQRIELNWEHCGESGGILGRTLFQSHWNTLCREFPCGSALCPSPRIGKALLKAP